ncbi:GNAT family N-acetyltransferase [Parasphingorhabdus sp.]|uniref:GNAT family N-acetyltransferase n=1 Tax=Parasphingorhabdus sp. TaxID=2709688 RepID=UPI003FA7CF90
MMRLRTAELNDAPSVTALFERAYPTLMAASYDAAVLAVALPEMTRANPTLLASRTYYVIEDGERLIGCGGWTIEKPGSGEVKPGLAHLRHFATDPDRAREGIGRSIYNRCAIEASNSKITKFQAFAGLNAEPFYQRMGLERIRVVDVPMGPSIKLPTVLMKGPVCAL